MCPMALPTIWDADYFVAPAHHPGHIHMGAVKLDIVPAYVKNV